MISECIYDDIPPQIKHLNIFMYFLTINIENALFFTKPELHKRRITATLTNYKQHWS